MGFGFGVRVGVRGWGVPRGRLVRALRRARRLRRRLLGRLELALRGGARVGRIEQLHGLG